MDKNVTIALVLLLAIVVGTNIQGALGASSYSEEDVRLLARLIDAEARGEPYQGKVAVGAVVINRVRDPRFPNTIREVIYEPRQFYAEGIPKFPNPSAESLRAAQAAARGEDPTGGALFFYNPDKAVTTSWWASRTRKVRIGNHVFSQ